MVLEWASLHRDELRDNWERAMDGLPLEEIDPLIDRRKTTMSRIIRIQEVEGPRPYRVRLKFTVKLVKEN